LLLCCSGCCDCCIVDFVLTEPGRRLTLKMVHKGIVHHGARLERLWPAVDEARDVFSPTEPPSVNKGRVASDVWSEGFAVLVMRGGWPFLYIKGPARRDRKQRPHLSSLALL
jgi:hypothetical protein